MKDKLTTMDKYNKRFLIIIVSWLVYNITIIGLKYFGLINKPINPGTYLAGIILASCLFLVIIEHMHKNKY